MYAPETKQLTTQLTTLEKMYRRSCAFLRGLGFFVLLMLLTGAVLTGLTWLCGRLLP